MAARLLSLTIIKQPKTHETTLTKAALTTQKALHKKPQSATNTLR